MEIVKFSFPTEIFFGAGASQQLASKLSYLQIKRPLVVTDDGFAQSQTIRKIIENLQNGNLQSSLFHNFLGNPVSSHVAAGVKAFMQHDADCIVGVGGGAALDVAKAIGLMAFHPGDLKNYEDGQPNRLAFNQPMPYLVAIPTTSGTGSEVGRCTVISDDETLVKKFIFDPILMPKLVLADPELTLGLPDKMTAATGMDALSHLMESFIAKGFHPMCDGIALEGLRILSSSLPGAFLSAKQYPQLSEDSLKYRSEMMAAALMGAVAFQKGLGVTHACAHALSTVCGLHHGLANAIMLPYAMDFNQTAVEEKFTRLLQVINTEDRNFGTVSEYLIYLQTQVEIPHKLSEVKVTSSHIADLVDVAFKDPSHLSNPRKVSKEDLKTIFTNAL